MSERVVNFGNKAALLVFGVIICLCFVACGPQEPSEPGLIVIGTSAPPAIETPSEAHSEPSETMKPTAEPTVEPTPEPAASPTPTPEPTASPTFTPEPTEEPTASPTSTPEPTAEPTDVPAATDGPQVTPTPAPTIVTPRISDATPYVTPGDGSTFDIVLDVVGDCMLASYKNEDADNGFKEYANREDPKYFLEKVAPYFQSDDFTIANLECVLTDKVLPPIEKREKTPYWYYGKTENTRILTEAGVEAVSLANNHMLDYGQQGWDDTIDAVRRAGFKYASWNETFFLEKNGFRIAVICTNLYVLGESDIAISLVQEAARVSDFQIVFFHGGKMGIHAPEQWKIEACHRIVDGGADLVIGAHPHVLQPREIYKGVDIVYSLGNFCYGGSRRPENRTIIYRTTLSVDVDNGKLVSTNSELIPCYVYTGPVNNFQPAPITDHAEYQRVIDFMNWKVDSPV